METQLVFCEVVPIVICYYDRAWSSPYEICGMALGKVSLWVLRFPPSISFHPFSKVVCLQGCSYQQDKRVKRLRNLLWKRGSFGDRGASGKGSTFIFLSFRVLQKWKNIQNSSTHWADQWLIRAEWLTVTIYCTEGAECGLCRCGSQNYICSDYYEPPSPSIHLNTYK